MFIEPVHNEDLPKSEKEKAFIFLVLLIYSAVAITGIFFHPLWRDEFHTWSIAGASSSIKELLQNKVYEGHPNLWYLLLYALRFLSDNPLSMQLMHVMIAIATVFLVLKYAPFTRHQKILLVFGYFYLFEYALISRNYAIGVFLITLLLTLYRYRQRFLFPLSLILFLLAQTSVFGLILTVAFMLTWTFEFIFSSAFRIDLLRQKLILLLSILMITAGITLSLYSIIPPASGYFAGSSHFSLVQMTLRETIRTVATVWKAWFPVPRLNLQFWNSNIIRIEIIQAILSLVLVFSAGIFFIKRPVIFFLYITGMTGIIAFILMYYYGYIRHHGHLYILLITCLWIKSFYRENNNTLHYRISEKFHGWLNKNASRIFLILLAVQMFAGIYAYTVQLFVPFSASRITARYIREQNLDRFLIAGDADVALEPVLGYLNKEAFFFSRNAFSNYLIYDQRRNIPTHSTVLVMADSLITVHGDTILLVMNYPLKEHPGLNLRKVQSFEKSIRYDEIYYLYLLCSMENKPALSSREIIKQTEAQYNQRTDAAFCQCYSSLFQRKEIHPDIY